MAAVAMNILRLISQNALIGKDAPLRHAAKRRRMKTVMREILFKAGRMIKHAGCWVLEMGANDSANTVFERMYTHSPRNAKPARPSVVPGCATKHANTSQHHFAACAGTRCHAQKLASHTKVLYRGIRIW